MTQIPVLSLGGLLLISIQGDLPDDTAVTLQNDVNQAIADTGARGLIIDISALDVVDSFLARILAEIAACSQLLAAKTVLVGMRPAVAITMVELGLSLPGLSTARTVVDGAAVLGVPLPDGRGRVAP